MVIAKLKAWLFGALALVGALVGVYLAGRRDAASAARVVRLENEIDDMSKAYEVEHEVNGIDRSAIDARLDQWVRDK